VPEYNDALRTWAAGNRLPVIDAQAFFERQPTALFSDECHFFPPGYEKMAELVRDRLVAGPDPYFAVAAGRDALVPAGDGGQSRPRGVERTASSREP
jgi:hypothetical protein